MFEQVKQEIDDKIKTNGSKEITATRLNGVLQDIMDATAEELNGYVQKTDPPSPAVGDLVVFDEFGGFGTSEKTVNDFATAEQGAKADTALQPTGVKTINNQSIVGSGNITIEGGGTDDYADLDNKPQINSVTLSGNKSATDLGLATATQGAKADTALQPTGVKTINNQSIVGSGNITIEGGTDDYADLDNKPQINSVALSGNKSATDLGLATATQGAKADTAYQKPQFGIPSTDLTNAVQILLYKADTAVQQVTVGTTTTGVAGSSASVTNSGTPTAPVLDFTIPRGADGQNGQNGADAYNPFKGTYLITDTLPTTGQAGDYIYVVDSQTPPVTHVYTWNGTIFTDSGETVTISDSHFADIPIPISQINLLSLIKANFSYEAKQALITLLEHVAWVDGNGSQYINSLYNLLFAVNIIGIRAEYTQNHTVWSDGVSTLDDLKQDLIVYAIFSDNSEVEISGYVLSGTLASGTSIITVTYGELTSQFNVTVTQYGSVNVYSKSNGNLIVARGAIGHQGNIGLQSINGYTTHRNRKITGVTYGIKSLEDDSGVSLNPPFYPIKVPTGATQVTATITPNTYKIGMKLTFLVDGDYWDLPTKPQDTVHSIGTGSYAVGSATFDIAATGYAGRSDTYLISNMAPPSDGIFPDDQPTNVEITFF